MKLTITPRAQNWFKQEVDPSSGEGIRFYGKVYGQTNVHEGFSVGMTVDKPENPLYSETIDGILYFIEETDEWFFSGYDLVVNYNEKLDEPEYVFEQESLV